MSAAETLVPILATAGMFGMVFGIAYLKSRENMALIERGINPRLNNSGPRPFVYLKYGLLLVGCGLGLVVAFLIDMNLNHNAITPGGQQYERDYPAIYFALIAIGGGLGLVISFLIEKKYWMDKKLPD